jgi:phospholipase/carboxylesterase
MSASSRTGVSSRVTRAARIALVLALFGVRPAPAAQATDVLDPSDELLARGIQLRQHRVHGVEVLEVVLGRVDFDARLPLVMRIHGRGSDWQLPSGSYVNVEEPYRLIVPRGVVQTGERRSWAVPSVRNNQPARLEAEISASADRLVDVLKHFQSRRRSVGEPIVTGFSQGGMVALAMGVRHPGAIGTVLPMAAHLVVSLEPQRLGGARLPEVHALHGEADAIVAPKPAQHAHERLRGAGFVSTLRLLPAVGHEVAEPMAEAHKLLLMRALKRAAGQRFDIGA